MPRSQFRRTEDVLAHIRATPLGETPDAMRAAFAARAGVQPQGRAVHLGRIEALEIGSGRPMLWFHGGGFVMGAPETHMTLAQGLSLEGLRAILPRYRLAPEHRWPAPLEDALEALDALEGPVALGGDGAGGQLALAVARRRPERVAALVLLSPNTDRTGRSETRGSAADLTNDDAVDRRLWELAMPGVAAEDPDVSPLLADLAGLPPLHIVAATNEVLLDDAVLLARRAAQAGVPVELSVWPGLFHLWPLWAQAIPEGARALARARHWAFARLQPARASSRG